MITVSGLRKTYGRRVAVDDVSFDVVEGEIFGILGPNGAGKTTTVECIAGLRIGDSGSVRVAGVDPWTDRAAATRLIGVQLQDSKLQPKITVREALELWSAFYDDPVAWPGLAERLGLEEHLDQRFEHLSGGQQQRLSIALALVGDPRLVILDELTTGLDPRARRETWQLVRDVRERGTTVLLVTHSMEEAEHLCDRLAVIDGGRVRALDTPTALVSGGATVTSFVPSRTLDPVELTSLPGVTDVRREGERIAVEGGDDAVLMVLARLDGAGITPHRLRVTDRGLDAAYLDLTEKESVR